MSVKAEASRKRTEFWKKTEEKTTSEKKEQVMVEEEEEKKKKKKEEEEEKKKKKKEEEEEKGVEGKEIEIVDEMQEKRERQRNRLRFGVDDAEHEEEEEEAVMIGEEEVQGGRGIDDALSLDEQPLREGKGNDLYEQISSLESQVAAMERLVRREHLRVGEEGEGDESERLRRSERGLEARPGPAMGRERGDPGTGRCSVYLPFLSSTSSSKDEDELEEVVGGLRRDAGQWGARSGYLRDLEARLSKMEINVLEIHPQMQGRGDDGATCGSQPSYEGKIRSSGNEADGGKDRRTSTPRVADNRGFEKSPVHSSILDMCYRPTFHSSVIQEREMPEAARAEATKLWTTRDGCDTIQSLLTQLQEIQDECSDPSFLASSNGGAWVDREQLANGLNHHPAGLEEVKFAASRSSHGSEGTSRDAKNIILREQQLDALEARLAAITSKIRS
jgi:flagellar biosynthesis GTPase FlhF